MGVPHFHWFNVTNNDSPDRFGAKAAQRVVTPDYRIDAARAAERNGFESVLCMVGMGAPDPWILASSMIAATSRIRFLIAIRPHAALPTTVAHHAATFQAISNNRLDLNIVTGSNEDELRGLGDPLDKAARYARTAEFLDVLDGVFSGPGYSHHGDYYQIENGGLVEPLRERPGIFIGGSSPPGVAISAKHATVHLSYGEPPPLLKETVEQVREAAAREGRKVEFGIRIGVIAKRTHEEAWREADRILETIDPAQIVKQRPIIASRTSVAQARVQALNPGSKADPEALKIYPTMWAGTGLVSGGGGSTSLVGSYEEVAERIDEYLSIGVNHFIISGRPLLESSYELGEQLLSLFPRKAASHSNAA